MNRKKKNPLVSFCGCRLLSPFQKLHCTTGSQAESSFVSGAAKSEEQEVSFPRGREGGAVVCVCVFGVLTQLITAQTSLSTSL